MSENDFRDELVLQIIDKYVWKALNTRHPTWPAFSFGLPCSTWKFFFYIPTAIVDYNKWMGGVDLADQLLSYYSMTNRRTLKWWKKVFWRLVDITIINSWIIFHTNNPTSEINSQKQFRLKLAEELVQSLLDLRSGPHCHHHL